MCGGIVDDLDPVCRRNGCYLEVYEDGWCFKHLPFDSGAAQYTWAQLEWERDYWKREAEIAQQESVVLRSKVKEAMLRIKHAEPAL